MVFRVISLTSALAIGIKVAFGSAPNMSLCHARVHIEVLGLALVESLASTRGGSHPDSVGTLVYDIKYDFAFKTLTGAIQVEDNPIQGHLQQQHDPSPIQEDGCFRLPESGMPNFFHNDVPAQVDSPEKHVPIEQFPLNPAFVPHGNANTNANLRGYSWLRPQQPILDPRTSNIRQG
ncbi:unnamed protein product [Ilex paraguariensis]|uniref:Uncharacterized protein n=1 Tax=Ilex paraguariensis TaxID=185542 RepID=A0ABC8S3E2_9AQUA